MENHEQHYESIDALRRHEKKVDWTDELRFLADCAALAKDNPELTEWLEDYGGRLV